jgi:hypothetical protein
MAPIVLEDTIDDVPPTILTIHDFNTQIKMPKEPLSIGDVKV